jgi:hypothetical protein
MLMASGFAALCGLAAIGAVSLCHLLAGALLP